ncbi:transposase [Bacillus haikouensis]|uniref:transposase n=1 Tax=Bacillus haikouensis TaxID=1510468 RepID=UPI001555C078|nr:transposase [Bacillus haikouensis]
MYKKREWSPGFTYHITARGNRKYNIFRNKDDRLMYLNYLEDAKQKYPFILHSYCLMTNHIHLLLQTENDPPGKIIHQIHYRYARYFNKKNGFQGHLFEGPYRSTLIKNNKQLIDTSCYIHLNPVRAGIGNEPDGYRWSSYRSFITNRINIHVNQDRVLACVNNSKNLYKFYTETKLHQFNNRGEPH